MSRKERYEVRSLERAVPLIRKLVESTSRLSKPELLLSVGHYSYNVDKALKLASACSCSNKVEVRAIVTPELEATVRHAISNTEAFTLVSIATREKGPIPNFIVSDAGYYLQNGFKFDDAVVSFRRDEVNEFLTSLFEENSMEAA